MVAGTRVTIRIVLTALAAEIQMLSKRLKIKLNICPYSVWGALYLVQNARGELLFEHCFTHQRDAWS